MRKIIFFLFLFSFSFANAQTDSAALPHKHSWFEIWEGHGEDGLVCYKQSHRNFFFTTFGLVLVLGVVILNRYKAKKKSEKELQIKNAIIEEKNKNITDSIRYAKHIQQSQMMSEKQIQKTLERLRKK